MDENTKNTIFSFTFGIGRLFFTEGSVFYRCFGNRPKVKNPPSVGHYYSGAAHKLQPGAAPLMSSIKKFYFNKEEQT